MSLLISMGNVGHGTATGHGTVGVLWFVFMEPLPGRLQQHFFLDFLQGGEAEFGSDIGDGGITVSRKAHDRPNTGVHCPLELVDFRHVECREEGEAIAM